MSNDLIVALTVFVPSAIRQRLKVAAARHGNTMTRHLTMLLDRGLSESERAAQDQRIPHTEDMIS